MINRETQSYLLLGLKLKEISAIAQVRLLNNINYKWYYEQNKYDLNIFDHCHKCNKDNTFLHKLIECENYEYKRIDSGLPIKENKMLDIFDILEKPNLKKCKNFINYILYTLSG